MPSPRHLKPVARQRGRPLYLVVKETIWKAIDTGDFQPGQQIPSTKDVSDQMKVSVVTAHRALQELVAAGILLRTQGHGTFVHDRYRERARTIGGGFRVGLVFNPDMSLADFHDASILEGVRQGADEHAVDLVYLRLGEDLRNECNGYLYVKPPAEVLEAAAQRATRRRPAVVVGARSEHETVASFDVDNVEVGRLAAQHLLALGHRRIGCVGGADDILAARDRWNGFVAKCDELGMASPDDEHRMTAAGASHHGQREGLFRMLSDAARRPTAVFAAGYELALDVYAAAAQAGLRIPHDLSVVGIDDPPSAAFLQPALTTLRAPLIELGKMAVAAMSDLMRYEAAAVKARTLHAQLVERGSTAPIE